MTHKSALIICKVCGVIGLLVVAPSLTTALALTVKNSIDLLKAK